MMYLNILIDFASLIVLGGIAILTYITSKRYNKLLIKPSLYLIQNSPSLIRLDKLKNVKYPQFVWYLGNGSMHPAVNVLLRHKSKDFCTKWVSCSSVAGDNLLELFWVYNAEIIEISYTDISGKKYFISSFNNLKISTSRLSENTYKQYSIEADSNQENNLVCLLEKFKLIEKHDLNISYIEFMESFSLVNNIILDHKDSVVTTTTLG